MNYQEFLDTIKQYPKIDTHEHIPAERFAVGNQIDFFDFLVPYICDNLLTAGATTEQWVLIQSKHMPFEERWETFELFIEDIRHTTYFKALWRTFHECYGMSEMSLEEAKRVSLMLQEENKAGLYKKIFDRNKIESTLSFVPWNSIESGQDEGLYPVPTVSDICIRAREDIAMIERVTGVNINSFDSLLSGIRRLLDQYSEKNVKGIKFGSAYRRKLDFDATSREDAEKVFLKVMSEKVNGDSKMCGMPSGSLMLSDAKPLDDFLTDFMTGIAGEKGLPVFFHVGIHAWNENSVESIHASYLETLIRRHPETKFILLHCGMPFIDDAIILCKYFRNVSLNMTWCHIIDREQSRLCVRKFIELLPVSKITGFGGDYIYPQQVYGHLQFAIENIGSALWELVEKNEMGEQDALIIARKWFYDNPKKLLKL
jgi:hypothetical protein